jgi:hypothetical protein
MVFVLAKLLSKSYDIRLVGQGQKMSKLKIRLFAIFTLFLLALSISSAAAQYNTQQTSTITVDPHGSAIMTDSLGVTYDIQGIPGSTGSVTTALYNGNPQPAASVPAGKSLTYFVVITFNMNAADFGRAVITIPYTDADVAGAQAPYAIFKYMPATDSYVELASTIDTAAKTFTVTLTSVDDPLFAIGGASTAVGPTDTTSWIIIAVAIVIIVILAVFIIRVARKQ